MIGIIGIDDLESLTRQQPLNMRLISTAALVEFCRFNWRRIAEIERRPGLDRDQHISQRAIGNQHRLGTLQFSMLQTIVVGIELQRGICRRRTDKSHVAINRALLTGYEISRSRLFNFTAWRRAAIYC